MYKKWPLLGVTLAELMIAMVIISILGTYAMVTYVRVYEKNRGVQAYTVLRMIRTAERLYYLDWNVYIALPVSCASNLVTERYLQCPNSAAIKERGFNYVVTSAAPTNYVATATREPASTSRYHGNTILLTVSCCPESPTWGGSWPWSPN